MSEEKKPQRYKVGDEIDIRFKVTHVSRFSIDLAPVDDDFRRFYLANDDGGGEWAFAWIDSSEPPPEAHPNHFTITPRQLAKIICRARRENYVAYLLALFKGRLPQTHFKHLRAWCRKRLEEIKRKGGRV